MAQYVIGIDIGGTTVKFAVVQKGIGIINEYFIQTEAEKDPDNIIQNIADKCLAISENHSDLFSNTISIGIGVPGCVAIDGATVSNPPNFPKWGVVPIGDMIKKQIEKKSPVAIKIENDANVAALGECFYGAGKSFNHFVMITLGTGIGGGIIIDNKIFRGENGYAGEVGQYTINFDSPSIHVGVRGSMESFIGWTKIAEHAKKLTEKFPDSTLNKILIERPLNAKDISDAGRLGDKVALETWKYVGEILGIGMSSIIAILDISKFIIGGGVSGAYSLFIPHTENAVKRYARPVSIENLEIVPAQLGNKAGMVGAASLWMH